MRGRLPKIYPCCRGDSIFMHIFCIMFMLLSLPFSCCEPPCPCRRAGGVPSTGTSAYATAEQGASLFGLCDVWDARWGKNMLSFAGFLEAFRRFSGCKIRGLTLYKLQKYSENMQLRHFNNTFFYPHIAIFSPKPPTFYFCSVFVHFFGRMQHPHQYYLYDCS